MSWLVLGANLLLVLIVLTVPLLAPQEDSNQSDLAEIKSKLAAVERERANHRLGDEEAKIATSQLEQRAISILDGQKDCKPPKKPLIVLLPLAVAISAVAVYAAVGAPNFKNHTVYESDFEQSGLNDIPPEQLVDVLAATLAEDENPPAVGYQLLGRTLMTLGRFEEAFAAYETASELSGDDPTFNAEFERAKKYVESLER